VGDGGPADKDGPAGGELGGEHRGVAHGDEAGEDDPATGGQESACPM
jgi:hypothetical protein